MIFLARSWEITFPDDENRTHRLPVIRPSVHVTLTGIQQQPVQANQLGN